MDQELLRQKEFEQTAVVDLEALLRVARRMTGDTAQAEDAVQRHSSQSGVHITNFRCSVIVERGFFAFS